MKNENLSPAIICEINNALNCAGGAVEPMRKLLTGANIDSVIAAKLEKLLSLVEYGVAQTAAIISDIQK